MTGIITVGGSPVGRNPRGFDSFIGSALSSAADKISLDFMAVFS
jgi:hypothetical protein